MSIADINYHQVKHHTESLDAEKKHGLHEATRRQNSVVHFFVFDGIALNVTTLSWRPRTHIAGGLS